ncbi:hypothetical protein ABPG75_004335 [Micractinium tetrahymenae]
MSLLELLLAAVQLALLLTPAGGSLLGLACPPWLLAAGGAAVVVLNLPAALRAVAAQAGIGCTATGRSGTAVLVSQAARVLADLLDSATTFRGCLLLSLVLRGLLRGRRHNFDPLVVPSASRAGLLRCAMLALALLWWCRRQVAAHLQGQQPLVAAARAMPRVWRSRAYALLCAAYWLGVLSCLTATLPWDSRWLQLQQQWAAAAGLGSHAAEHVRWTAPPLPPATRRQPFWQQLRQGFPPLLDSLCLLLGLPSEPGSFRAASLALSCGARLALALLSAPRWAAAAYRDDLLHFGSAVTPERWAASQAVFAPPLAGAWLPAPAVPLSRGLRLAFARLHGAQLDVAAERAVASTLAPLKVLLKLPGMILIQALPTVGHGLATFPRLAPQPALSGIPARQAAAAAVAPLLASELGPAAAAGFCAFCGADVVRARPAPAAVVSTEPGPPCTCACGVPVYCCPAHQSLDWPRHQLACRRAQDPAAPVH